MPDSEVNNLSPWAHPKATQWFEAVLEKSGFLEEVEQQVNQAETLLDVQSGRLLLAMLVMLGRPGVWPAMHRKVLARAANSVNRISTKAASSDSGATRSRKPITLDEHQRKEKAKLALATEVEIVRRWAGVSNRSTEIKQPESWGEYWG